MDSLFLVFQTHFIALVSSEWELSSLNADWVFELLKKLFIQYGPRILTALATLIVGWWLIKMMVRMLRMLFERSRMEVSLKLFLTSLVGVLLKIMLFITILSMLGITMTSFIAVLGALGLAIGMALSGTVQNFAGGVMILLFKPFKVGDVIEAQGYIGTVQEIQIFMTRMLTPDNKTVLLPNSNLSNEALTNYTTAMKIRVDLEIGIAYNASVTQAKKVLLQVLQDDKRVLEDPAPFVGVLTLADSSVMMAVRCYVPPTMYWEAYFGLLEECKKALDLAKIEIPFPQRVLHTAPVK